MSRIYLSAFVLVWLPPIQGIIRLIAMKGKTVVLGVTGSIAAHRAVDLASLLAKAGCAVHVVMTAEAQRFVTALALQDALPPCGGDRIV